MGVGAVCPRFINESGIELPRDVYQQVLLNGIIYYLFDGVYYRPYIYGGQTVYLVYPAP